MVEKGLSRLKISGYKSIGNPIEIDIKPLTILSGANSSGKSSIMQPLLLIKQTLEAQYNPGSLVLDGSHLNFNHSNQILTHEMKDKLEIEIEIDKEFWNFCFVKGNDKEPLKIQAMQYKEGKKHIKLKRGMKYSQLIQQMEEALLDINSDFSSKSKVKWDNDLFFMYPKDIDSFAKQNYYNRTGFSKYVSNIIHLAALRFAGKREYAKSVISNRILGTFDHYVASILSEMAEGSLNQVISDMKYLNLTSDIITKRKPSGQISIHVSRLKDSDPSEELKRGEYVNIVDVGVGISQVLPIVVALRYAKPGQLVIIEQPEIHLHPKAQRLFCDLIVKSANRGVKIVIETHSQIILRGIQIQVAKDEIPSEDVNLIWFSLNEDGLSEAKQGQLNKSGAYLNWPTDFDDVILEIEGEYLRAGR